MGVYRYQAIGPLESIVRGTITADSIQQARRELREQGLVIRRIREYHTPSKLKSLVPDRSSRQWEQSVDELAMLLQAGIPLLDALEALVEETSGEFRTTIESVRDRVANGSSLADAMKAFPRVFDLVSIHLVEVGESTGELDDVLRELANFKRQHSQFKDQVTTILIYPAFLTVLGVSAAIFLMTYVMPPLLESLQETMTELPWPTQVVQGFSNTLVSHGWTILIGSIVVVACAIGIMRVHRVRRQIDRAWLRVPLFGPLTVKQTIARIAMVISVLSRSGIPLTRAFQLAAQTCRNLTIRAALSDCAELVGTGKSIPEALKHSGVFPSIVLQIFSVGQESGRLEELLSKLSEDYTRQVAVRSARIAALLEPAMIILLALFIGFLMLAIILPILEAGNVV